MGTQPSSPERGRSPSPIFGPCLLRPNSCMNQDATWYRVGLGPDDIVLDGEPAPLSKKGAEPPLIFGPCLLWPNCWMDQGGTWHGGGPWSRPHCARWGHSSPPPKRGRAPQFWPMSIVANRLDGLVRYLEVDLGPGHFVLDGFPAIGERGTAAPSFRPMPIVATVAHLSYC